MVILLCANTPCVCVCRCRYSITSLCEIIEQSAHYAAAILSPRASGACAAAACTRFICVEINEMPNRLRFLHHAAAAAVAWIFAHMHYIRNSRALLIIHTVWATAAHTREAIANICYVVRTSSLCFIQSHYPNGVPLVIVRRCDANHFTINHTLREYYISPCRYRKYFSAN